MISFKARLLFLEVAFFLEESKMTAFKAKLLFREVAFSGSGFFWERRKQLGYIQGKATFPTFAAFLFSSPRKVAKSRHVFFRKLLHL